MHETLRTGCLDVLDVHVHVVLEEGTLPLSGVSLGSMDQHLCTTYYTVCFITFQHKSVIVHLIWNKMKRPYHQRPRISGALGMNEKP